MLTDEANTHTSTSIESACLPIGCSVSAKYRGAFCSAQVKTVERQVKIKVTLFDTGDTITISEEQIVHSVPLRIGNTILIRLTSTSNSHHSRSGLASIINPNDNFDKKQGTIKQIYDNSIYTVIFNDGDEKSLRRSSLCLQGIRLYQTQIGKQKLLEDIPTSSTLPKDSNEISSIVAVHRHGNNTFPALILKRKSLADYIWVKSFLDGREYIVHKRDDVQAYKNNSHIQSLCRLTSKQATKACEKFIKYNQIPIIWQKKKKKQLNNEQDNTNYHDSNTSGSDVDDSDEEMAEEKDSFVAQLFAFMDDRGTPINNIPKIHNYDLDLHRLYKIVRTFGGYNKVTKNDQWSKVYIKMGLPDESSSKNGRSIELAYKKYLFSYEDLSKKLGTINAPNAYFGGRTTMGSDSRRSLIRARQESEEKKSLSIKQQSRKRLSIDSKQSLSSTKNQSNSPRRKTIIIKPSSSTSESELSDNETILNKNKIKRQQAINSKKIISIIKKPPIISDEKKKITGIKNSLSLIDLRSTSAPVKKSKSTNDTEDNMKPIIKIPKISYEILMGSTLATGKHPKRQTHKIQDNTSTNKGTSKQEPFSESIKQTSIHDFTPLAVTPVSPSPPPSIIDELPSCFANTQNVSHEVPSIFQTIMPPSTINQQINEIEKLPSNSNKRQYENSDDNSNIDDQSSPSKRSRHSISSEESTEKSSLISMDQNKQRNQNLSNDQDNVWNSLLNEDGYSPTLQKFHLLHPLPIKQETIDSSLTNQQSSSISIEPIAPCHLSTSTPNSPPDHRRISIRQQKRRTIRDPKDSSISTKRKTKLDIDVNSNFNIDNINNSDSIPIPIEQQQQSVEIKRYRTVGKRIGKRTVNQPDNENEDFHSNSPINVTLRQQLEDMFKDRSSRYDFLDLNNNLAGDHRLSHIKDHMRQCQKVFFNLKSALKKIEKQRKICLRRPKPSTTDLLLPSTCT